MQHLSKTSNKLISYGSAVCVCAKSHKDFSIKIFEKYCTTRLIVSGSIALPFLSHIDDRVLAAIFIRARFCLDVCFTAPIFSLFSTTIFLSFFAGFSFSFPPLPGVFAEPKVTAELFSVSFDALNTTSLIFSTKFSSKNCNANVLVDIEIISNICRQYKDNDSSVENNNNAAIVSVEDNNTVIDSVLFRSMKISNINPHIPSCIIPSLVTVLSNLALRLDSVRQIESTKVATLENDTANA